MSIPGPPEDHAVLEALRRQIEDPEDHDLSLIDQCLALTPDQRLHRLSAWVDLVSSARPVEPPTLR